MCADSRCRSRESRGRLTNAGNSLQVWRVPALVGITLGLTFLLLGFRMFRRAQTRAGAAARATGRITSVQKDESSDSITWWPTITFRASDGATYSFTGSGQPRELESGTRVAVRYDPLNPATAWVTGSARPFFLPVLVMCAGIGLVLGFVAFALAG
jgi:hypothetical protein